MRKWLVMFACAVAGWLVASTVVAVVVIAMNPDYAPGGSPSNTTQTLMVLGLLVFFAWALYRLIPSRFR